LYGGIGATFVKIMVMNLGTGYAHATEFHRIYFFYATSRRKQNN